MRWSVAAVLVFAILGGCATSQSRRQPQASCPEKADPYAFYGFGRGGNWTEASSAAFENARQKFEHSGMKGYGLVERQIVGKDNSNGWYEMAIQYQVVPLNQLGDPTSQPVH